MTEAECLKQLTHAADLVEQVQQRAAKIEDDAKALWLALKDLSYACDGVTAPQAPPRDVYNHSYAMLQRMVRYASR
jgi:hypothetical protein